MKVNKYEFRNLNQRVDLSGTLLVNIHCQGQTFKPYE